jgi:acetolactate synthase-1/2/3 large subunit
LADFPGEISPLWGRSAPCGPAASSELQRAALLINAARRPLVLMGLQASQPASADAIKRFLAATGLPYASTFQGPGGWAAPSQYAGKLGLFRNQPADRLLDDADCVITVGFDPIEFDPSLWNSGKTRPLVAIDVQAIDQDQAFLPQAELIGDLDASLEALAPLAPAAGAGGGGLPPQLRCRSGRAGRHRGRGEPVRRHAGASPAGGP